MSELGKNEIALSKVQAVLDYDIRTTDYIFGEAIKVMQFTGIRRHPDDSSDSVVSIRIKHDAWKELGEPDKITVSVESGDVLNEGTD